MNDAWPDSKDSDRHRLDIDPTCRIDVQSMSIRLALDRCLIDIEQTVFAIIPIRTEYWLTNGYKVAFLLADSEPYVLIYTRSGDGY